jgi:glycosyltransferase involved in cell wall biosynthesis
MLERHDFDMSRLHFTGRLPYAQYVKVLQESSVHVYLTRSFVLSWSMLEAMSTGCLIVASGTQPVTEVIKNRENGFLVDFFNVKEIADRVHDPLYGDRQMQEIKRNARQTILDHYELSKLLPKHLAWIRQESNSLPNLKRQISSNFVKAGQGS